MQRDREGTEDSTLTEGKLKHSLVPPFCIVNVVYLHPSNFTKRIL
jgi:hypothetical protein